MNPLKRVKLGRSDLNVTRLGLGGAPLGGLFEDSTDAVAIGAVRRSLELGINLFDTAPLYGAGKSETRVGKGLAGQDRDSYVLATKVGFSLVPEEQASNEVYFPFINPPPFRPVMDFSYDAVMRSFEESLRRLNVGRIDILHIHEPDEHCDAIMAGAHAAVRKLRKEGVIGAVSIGTNVAETVSRFVRAEAIDCALLAGRYSLLDQTALPEALPLCEKAGVSIIFGGPYNSGILATGAKPGALFNYVPADAGTLNKVRQIEAICRDYEVPLRAAALQFPLAHPAIAAVIPGARSAQEIEENFRLMSHSIPNQFWVALRKARLLGENVPVPAAELPATASTGSKS
jgi:D-threo-aldose 1-dehydrogenase